MAVSSDAGTALNRSRGDGRVDVHWLDVHDQSDACALSMTCLLDANEMVRLASFRHAADAKRYLFGAVMVRQLAGRRLGIPGSQLTVDRRCPSCDRHHGRPSVRGSDLRISVTHSGDMVGVALSLRDRVGLDVEQVGARIDPAQLAARILHPDDATVLRSAELSDDQLRDAFFDHWTAKEAALKAVGSGLRIDPRAVAISAHPDSDTRTASVPGHRQLHLRRWTPKPGHLATVATEPSAEVHHHVIHQLALEVT